MPAVPETALRRLAASDASHCAVLRETSRHRCPRWMQWGPSDGPLKMQLQALPSEWSLGVLCLKALPSELAKVGWMWQAWGRWREEMRVVIGALRWSCAPWLFSSARLAIMLLLLFFELYRLAFYAQCLRALNLPNLFVGYYLVGGLNWTFWNLRRIRLWFYWNGLSWCS